MATIPTPSVGLHFKRPCAEYFKPAALILAGHLHYQLGWVIIRLMQYPVGVYEMRNPRDTTITCTKEARIKAKVLAAHLDIPVWVALDMAVTEMLKRQNLPEPLLFQGVKE